MPNPERRSPEPIDFGAEAPKKEVPKPVEMPETPDVGTRVQEREDAHVLIQDIDRKLQTASEEEKAQLQADRKRLVGQVMEINADLEAEGVTVPRQVDFGAPAMDVTDEMIIGPADEEPEPEFDIDVVDEQAETPVTDEMIVETAPAEQDGYALGDISTETEEAYSLNGGEVKDNADLVAEELGVTSEGLDSLKTHFEEMQRMAAQDSATKAALEPYKLDFSWEEFMNQAESPKERGFLGRLKKSLFGTPGLRQSRMDRITNAYTEVIAAGQAGVKGAKAGRLADAQSQMQNPEPPRGGFDRKV